MSNEVRAWRMRDGWAHQIIANGIDVTVPMGGDQSRLMVRQVWGVRYWRDGKEYMTAADFEEQAHRDLRELRDGRGLVATVVSRWVVVGATEWELHS